MQNIRLYARHGGSIYSIQTLESVSLDVLHEAYCTTLNYINPHIRMRGYMDARDQCFRMRLHVWHTTNRSTRGVSLEWIARSYDSAGRL